MPCPTERAAIRICPVLKSRGDGRRLGNTNCAALLTCGGTILIVVVAIIVIITGMCG